ncbi:MAG: hypothetical protein WC686_04265 [Candidatus Shapirobacteria bacterium]|jgi:hypothetical protein
MSFHLIKPAFARICNRLLDPDCSKTSDPVATTTSFIQIIISLLLTVGIIYILYHGILAGFKFVTSEGDSKKIEEAKNDLMNIFVGVVVMFSVFAFLKLIGSVFGIPNLENLTITLPTL